MNNSSIDSGKFNGISTRGRFIYGFLCIRNVIAHFKLKTLPVELNDLFYEFVSSDRLDVWHEKVEDILPSSLIDSDDVKGAFFSEDVIRRVKQYYQQQPNIIIDMIENLFWLGIANLYVAFNSEKTLLVLSKIIQEMEANGILLPDFNKVKNCSSSQDEGWGKEDNLGNYIE